jgi:hypothetical protein
MDPYQSDGGSDGVRKIANSIGTSLMNPEVVSDPL